MTGWSVLWQHRGPLDPDYPASPPTVVTFWLDNLDGIVVGINSGDGANVLMYPLPKTAVADLAAVLTAQVRAAAVRGSHDVPAHCEHGEEEPHSYMERRQRSCELPEGWCEGPAAVVPEGGQQ